eukprot:scaffold284300_cov30-Tisochrysis_lutea.AAC.10
MASVSAGRGLRRPIGADAGEGGVGPSDLLLLEEMYTLARSSEPASRADDAVNLMSMLSAYEVVLERYVGRLRLAGRPGYQRPSLPLSLACSYESAALSAPEPEVSLHRKGLHC